MPGIIFLPATMIFIFVPTVVAMLFLAYLFPDRD